MINKLTKVFVITMLMIVVIPVCVMAKTDLLAKLNGIEADINKLKTEYNSIITTYSAVINSLSAESKDTINNLASNILSDDIGLKVDAVKTELANSSVTGASEVLNAINGLETDVNNLINENKDALNELKSDYENLTVDESKQVIKKVKDIMVSVGINVDATDTYNKMITVIDDAHKIASNINKKIESVLKNNVNTFKEGLTLELVDNLITATKNKDRGAVIDSLQKAVDNISNADALRQELKSIKNDTVSLENKLMELDNLDEQDLIMLSDVQKKGLSDKLKLIEKDFIDFVKLIITNYSEVYLKAVFDKSKNVSIDKMIEYANKGLDIIADRENIINGLKNSEDVQNKLPEELISKAGILVALGVVDYADYNKEYINNNFSEEIEKIATFVIDEMLGYIDSIDSAMKNELKDSIANESSPDLSQTNVININASRFTTVERLKNLQTRVEEELLSTQEKLKEKLSKYSPRVYDIFNTNILDTIETIMSLENEKTVRAYQYNDLYSYIVTDTFVEGKDFGEIIGIPEKNQGILEFNKLANGKVRTGSTLTIKLSEYVYQIYYYAVLGDVDGNSVVDSMDMYKVIQHILENSKLQNEFYRAGNTNDDSKIDSMDMYNIIQIILKK